MTRLKVYRGRGASIAYEEQADGTFTASGANAPYQAPIKQYDYLFLDRPAGAAGAHRSIAFDFRSGDVILLEYPSVGIIAKTIGQIEKIEEIGTGEGEELRGTIASDIMYGFGGDDNYFTNASDRVVERAGQGYDTVFASAGFSLEAGSEVERIVATANRFHLSLSGNEFDQLIEGSDGDDVIDGKGGADRMVGGAGSDTYYVDNEDDVVVELSSSPGRDTIITNISWALGAEASIEELRAAPATGTLAINLTGSDSGNRLVGNAGTNILDGRGGIDELVGLTGNDTYVVDNARDKVIEAVGQGLDIVRASVDYKLEAKQEIEFLTTTDDAGKAPINLSGNEFANTIRGNAGDNVLSGGRGADTLISLGGRDTFLFDTYLGTGNVDTISGFYVPTDVIHLQNSIFRTLAEGQLSADAFKETSAGGPVDATDRILYNKATGALSYDSDGAGGLRPVQFAVIDNAAKLTHLDFFVV